MESTKGIHDAIIKACASTITLRDYGKVSLQQAKKIVCRASSIVTNGASVNVRQRNGLWAYCKKI